MLGLTKIFQRSIKQKHARGFSKNTFASRCVSTFLFLSSQTSSLENTFIRSQIQVLMSLLPPSITNLCSVNVVCNIPSQGCGWVGIKNFRQQFLLALPPQTHWIGGQKPKHLDTKCQSLNDWSSSSRVSTKLIGAKCQSLNDWSSSCRVSTKLIGEKLQSEFRPRHQKAIKKGASHFHVVSCETFCLQ